MYKYSTYSDFLDLVRHDAADPRPRRPLVLTRSIQRPRSQPTDVRGLWPRRYGGSFSGTVELALGMADTVSGRLMGWLDVPHYSQLDKA